jgi:exopolysaccharide biosynthesis polyprenyl glycosylphosphotransferase
MPMEDIRSQKQWIKTPEIGWICALVTLGSDFLALIIAGKIAEHLNRAFSPLPPQLNWGEWLGLSGIFWAFLVTTILVFIGQNYYSSRSQWRNYVQQAQSVTGVYLFSLVISYFNDPEIDIPRSLFISACLGSIAWLFLFRLISTVIFSQYQFRRQPISVFVIAKPERIPSICEAIATRTQYSVIDSLSSTTIDFSQAIEQIRDSGAREVIAEDLPYTELASSLYWQLRQSDIRLRLIPNSLAILYRRGKSEIFGGMPVIRIDSGFLSGWDYRLKRSLDIGLSLVGIVLLMPLFLVIAIVIKLNSPEGNVFFGQKRVGLHGKIFQIWKFRTMNIDAESQQIELEKLNQSNDRVMFKLKDDPRITPVGKLLRRYSLDELPQLFNVLIGQMSLVGPRPLPLRDVAKLSDWHHSRHGVLPGITGLWQISGRSNISNIHEAVRLDLFYVDQWSLNLDLEILIETIRIVLFGKGAY